MRRGLRFVRYADDCNIFVRSERAGRRVMTLIRGFLETRMRLPINEEKSGVRQPDEVQFLGFSFRCAWGRRRGWPSFSPARRATVEDENGEMTPPNWGRSLTSCMEGISRYLRAGYRTFGFVHRKRSRDRAARRPCPPPRQAIIVREKKLAFPLPTPESQRRQREGCRRLCVLRQGSMGEIRSTRNAEGLSTGMVRRTDGFAQSDVERSSLTAGLGPAHAGVLTYQSKEPDARPACPVL